MVSKSEFKTEVFTSTTLEVLSEILYENGCKVDES